MLSKSVYRVWRLVIVALAACAGQSAHGQATRDELLSQLRTVYSVPDYGSVQVSSFVLSEDYIFRSERADQVEKDIKAGRQVRISWHTLEWVLLDRSHPNAQRITGETVGEVRQGGYWLRVSPDLSFRHEGGSVGEFFAKDWRYFPPAIPESVERLTSRDCRIEHGDGSVVVHGTAAHNGQKIAITFDKTDWSLLRVEFGKGGSAHTINEVITFQKVNGVPYRWPRAVLATAEGFADYKPVRELHLVQAPDIATPVPEASLRWWRFSRQAIDEATGTVYGPEDKVIATGKSVKPLPRTATSVAISELREKAQTDSTVKIIPPARSETGRALLVGGIVCVVLAIGLLLRRVAGR